MRQDIVPSSLAERMSGWSSNAVPWKPHPYQQRALKFLLEHPFGGLLLDPGLGKTSVTLAALKLLLKERVVKRALVVAPKRAIYNVWPEEVSVWKDFQDFNVALLHGGAKDSVLRTLQPKQQIALINFEGLPWLFDKRANVKALGADVLVIDESSKMKDSTTVRFRAIRKYILNCTFKRRYILTGSPRPRHYLDLFGQIFILDRGEALGEYVTHYRNKFFFPTGFQMREWEPLPDAAEKINKLVAPLVLRLDAEDYLKLPKVLERDHYVELPEKVQTDYDSLEESFISDLFSAPLASYSSKRAKLTQIANGSVYVDPREDDVRYGHRAERPFKVVHTEKVDELVDLVEELQGEPLLLAIGFHHDVVAVRKALKFEVPCINGQTTGKQADDYIDRWNRGLLRVMMLHPASAGHALNLQKCNARHVAFFYLPDDYDHYDQTFKRVRRQGNKSAFVMRHHFITRGTVDEPKMRNLKRKGTEQKDFMEAMKEYCLKKYGRLPGAPAPQRPRR